MGSNSRSIIITPFITRYQFCRNITLCNFSCLSDNDDFYDEGSQTLKEVRSILKTTAFANTAAVVTGAVYLVCLILSWIAPDLLISLSNSWVHALNLEPLKNGKEVGLDTVLWGLATSTAFSWAVGYTFAYFYNKFVK